jgi:hypothetical protein
MHTWAGMRVGLLIVAAGLVLTAAACGGSDDSSSSSSATTSSPPPTQATVTTGASTTAATNAAPPCTADAISHALNAGGIQATAVNDFKCGNGWAGAGYSTAMFDGAALLQAQGGQWVVADRATACGNPSIPDDVHHYCTVS